MRSLVQESKVCPRCKEEKDKSEFYTYVKDDAIRMVSKCKQCLSEYAKERRSRDRDRLNERSRERYKENPEYFREHSRKFRERNPGFYKDYHKKWKEENPEYHPTWRKENRGKTRAYLANYRAKKAKATPKWVDLSEIAYIHGLAEEKGYVVDHIVPLQSDYVCGLHCGDNLRAIPSELNIKKGNRYWPDMW